MPPKTKEKEKVGDPWIKISHSHRIFNEQENAGA